MSLYKALNEEEALKARFNLLEDGEYDALVRIATQKVSSSGNVMAELILTVFDDQGEGHTITDYLVFTRNMLWKIKHFCDSAGLQEAYLKDSFMPQMAEKQHVRVALSRRTGNEIPVDKLNGKPYGTRYPDKNVVDDYVARTGKPLGLPTQPNDQNIPF